MRRGLVAVSLLLALWAGPAAAAPRSGFVTMDDGVRLAYDLYTPAVASPQPWPAVVLLHGLGGSKAQLAPAAQWFADHGYAALAYSVRGAGTSGGDFGLASPRDLADLRAMVAWLESQPGVSPTEVGCFGISLGGGECWEAAPTGIFRAIAPVATWTNLYAALWAGNVPRSGVLAGFATAAAARSPLLRQVALTAISGGDLALVRALAAQRSVAAQLPQVRTPVYLFQGRVDYAFDVAQAADAFALLQGPKRLYVGDFGHPPSTFASPDFPGYVLAQSLLWFDRFLKGQPNGIDAGPDVTLADRTGTRRVGSVGLPPTGVLTASFPGAATLRPGLRLPRALETFGGSVVRVRVRRLDGARRLVAVVLANGRVVTHGAIVPHVGLDRIRLADYVVYLPRGTRLALRLGPDGGAVDPAYLPLGGGTAALGPATLSLRTLVAPVSR